MISKPSPDRRSTLPAPDAEAAQRSAALAALIRAEIAAQGGSIGFDRYMELALYQPALGYYHAPAAIFGRGGDFVTAPEISSLYGQCLAMQCAEILHTLGQGSILEFGAGSGALAGDILSALAVKGALPERYLILELSPVLRQQQERRVAALTAALRERVLWIQSLPPHFEGVVLANEVLDAMPVQCFTKRAGQIFERRVAALDRGFVYHEEAADLVLQTTAQAIEAELEAPLPSGYRSEWSPWFVPWVRSLSQSLARGVALIIDYGYPRREFYHSQRSMGTLICHYQHRWHDDPFFHPGLQDISASVDFTAVAQAGAAEGLELLGYTSQAQFLLGCGVGDLYLGSGPDPHLSSVVKRLLLPSEMGERFKTIALGRGYTGRLAGFTSRDFRHAL